MLLLTTTHDELGIDLVIGGQGSAVALYVGVTSCDVGADVTDAPLNEPSILLVFSVLVLAVPIMELDCWLSTTAMPSLLTLM
ncbi:hypothetical protein [Aeromonas sp. QDB14]|uniref:hypothetical protein n=1 Tax=Aeromonas sp. QDB14 TaxID=2989836 RepID=UPI0022E5EC45|nr:hypothetical protein [Aeromonas sp. QDB14]